MKEGGGGDNLAIAWEYPGQTKEVIPARFSRVMNPSRALSLIANPMIAHPLKFCNSYYCTEKVYFGNIADGHTCGARIEYVKAQGKSGSAACTLVYSEFPEICPCIPDTLVTHKPTQMPSHVPTAVPSTSKPTQIPSHVPTAVPSTSKPTQIPSRVPTAVPSTSKPTQRPTHVPTAVPSTFKQTRKPVNSSSGGKQNCGSSNTNLEVDTFKGDMTDSKVLGCGGAFKPNFTVSVDGKGELQNGPQASAALEMKFDFAQEVSTYEWEDCCYICGSNLQMAGKLSSGWYCEKDFASTGIWLKGKDTHYYSNTYTGPVTGVCDPDGGTCHCGSDGHPTKPKGISLNRFYGDLTDEKVWGCGGAFALTGVQLKQTSTATVSQEGAALDVMAEMGISFGQQDSYLGWEGCCYVCGSFLQSAGRLSPGWYCEKDSASTGIWLKGNGDKQPPVEKASLQVHKPKTGPVSGYCDPNGGTCLCGSGGNSETGKFSPITLNRFYGDTTDQKVWGCGGAFQLTALEFNAQWQKTFTSGSTSEKISLDMGISFAQQDSYLGWEACCYICGANLQMAGKLSSGWYCEKDLASTGIWLKGAKKGLMEKTDNTAIGPVGPVGGYCDSNGGTCKCASDGLNIPITLPNFYGDKTGAQVMGCGGGFKLNGLQLKGQWGKTFDNNSTKKEIALDLKVDFDSGTIYDFKDWTTCCNLCGNNLQIAGKLSTGWYCTVLPTGVYLTGRKWNIFGW